MSRAPPVAAAAFQASGVVPWNVPAPSTAPPVEAAAPAASGAPDGASPTAAPSTGLSAVLASRPLKRALATSLCPRLRRDGQPAVSRKTVRDKLVGLGRAEDILLYDEQVLLEKIRLWAPQDGPHPPDYPPPPYLLRGSRSPLSRSTSSSPSPTKTLEKHTDFD